ncbi:DNA polymerase III subunit epsilon [Sulfuriferula plumbiphila]|uniref:DNA polymerase III subunit epsilon n=1 Tax=Sulfuriferula plumbiphila TaxID=171865 RepID=A0A512L7X1_9PROT|nr:DNA polymerase III subunit epsilon [Sulfuriferula plumbiphila]BBP04553.1 DNA polymerase III subunit epsilon [Sulfuriferula plumbiphila]GEP30579.1 DNA polymerase III subunit epsilon [Sulfuriferula plumbiphila]
MRQIFLDTETTGLDPRQGHRIIEVAGVEMVNRRLTGNRFHRYLNPERDIDAGAQQVHGLTSEFLQDKPRFADIVDELIAFLRGAELVIHNAPFDMGFLNAELQRLDRPPLVEYCPAVTDTLKLAKDLHPGQKNNLDALCRRYAVDSTSRTLHGALLDAELLGAVYLGMTRGQESLVMEVETAPAQFGHQHSSMHAPLRVILADTQELAAHDTELTRLEQESRRASLWRTTLAE